MPPVGPVIAGWLMALGAPPDASRTPTPTERVFARTHRLPPAPGPPWASSQVALCPVVASAPFDRTTDKRRYYLSAVGSATECAAVLDVLLRLHLIPEDPHAQGKALLDRVVAMLVGLAKRQSER